MILDGATRCFTLDRTTENILDAGLRQGIELPYSCKGGVCSTCRCKLVTGEVDMDVNFALEDYEVARGFILACQSYPATDKVTVDFDQSGHGMSDRTRRARRGTIVVVSQGRLADRASHAVVRTTIHATPRATAFGSYAQDALRPGRRAKFSPLSSLATPTSETAVAHHFFDKHRATLDRALQAIAERELLVARIAESPSPKNYGEGAADDGEGAVRRAARPAVRPRPAGHRRPGRRASARRTASTSASPIRSRTSTRCSRQSRQAQATWRKAGPEAWVGVSLEILERINKASFLDRATR